MKVWGVSPAESENGDDERRDAACQCDDGND